MNKKHFLLPVPTNLFVVAALLGSLLVIGLVSARPPKASAAAARCVYAEKEDNCQVFIDEYGLKDNNFTGGKGPQPNKCYVFSASSIGGGFGEVPCASLSTYIMAVCMDGQTYQYVLCADQNASIFPGGAPVKGKCYLVSIRAVEQPCSKLKELNNRAGDPARELNTGDCKGDTITPDNCGILNIVVQAIRILSALVGVVVVTMIAVGGVQYATARDNPQAVGAAKKRILSAILALVFYLMIFGLLQWLVPGGIL